MPAKNRLLAATTWKILCLAALCAAAAGPALWAADPAPILLWPHGAPDAKGDTPADKPTLTVWLPPAERANGTAVVICPGGGYNMVCTDHEGRQIAAWLNSLGIAGVMLDYRHSGRGYRHPAPLADAQRAIRTVRARADEWKVAIDHVGIMGFSAGGHLASTAATHFDQGKPAADDPVERAGCRPDFAILCYAVVGMGEPFTNRPTQDNLLGANPPPELVRSVSNEKQVTPQTPPTFLFQTDEDAVVPAENSVFFYLALRRAGVPAELHVFRTGARAGIGRQDAGHFAVAAVLRGLAPRPRAARQAAAHDNSPAPLSGRRLDEAASVDERPREEGQRRSRLHRRLDHRLLGDPRSAGRRRRLAKVLRPPQRRRSGHRRRRHRASALAFAERQRRRHRAQAGGADDRHEQRRAEHGGGDRRGRQAGHCRAPHRLPRTKVLVLAIFPRGADNNDNLRKVNDAANKLIAKLADERMVFYQDIYARFLDRDGKLPTAIMPDLLHPDEKGYEIWADATEPTVAKLMGEK